MEVPAIGMAELGAQRMDAAAIRVLPAARWAASRSGGRPVLDAAEPAGLAARSLVPDGYETVVLADSASCAEALSWELRGSVSVHKGALSQLPFQTASFGAVLCDQEHLARGPLDLTLSELRRVLAADGVLVIIGECERRQGISTAAPALHELELAIGRHFAHSGVVSQTDLLVSTVGGDDDGAAVESVAAVQAGHTRKEAFVAASDQADRIQGSRSVFVNAIDVDALTAAWEQAMQASTAARGQAQAARRSLSERDDLIKELFLAEQALAEAFDVRGRLEGLVAHAADQQAELARARSELDTLRTQLAATHAEAALLAAAHNQANQQVADLQASTSWRLTGPLRRIIGGVKFAKSRL